MPFASRLTSTTAWLTAFALAIAGCSVPLAEELSVVENLCEDAAQCPGGTCTSVDGVRRCVATSADLAGVVFQLEGTSADGTTISHVFEKGLSIQGTRDEGVLVALDLDVPAPVSFGGSFVAPGDPIPGCTGADGSVPVKVELRSAAALSGLEQVFTRESEPRLEGGVVAEHRFDLEVPAGTYDVYVAPLAQPVECGAPLPPRVFPAVDVSTDVVLAPEAEAPRRLTGFIHPADDRSLEGFRLELVDPKRGLPVSEAIVIPALADPSAPVPLRGGPDGADERGVAYYYTEGLVVRLTDAGGKLVIHWVLDALDREGDGEIAIDLADLIANPRPFRASVLDAQLNPLPAASVTVKSVTLTGDVSQNAQFRVNAESDAAGDIEVELVPGTYEVLVTPTAEGGPALLEDEWEITKGSLCCGKSFVLGARPLITGSASTELGEAVSAVPVLASPTSRAARSYFSTVFESLALLPRQAASTTDPSSSFSLAVDPGEYDVSLRSPSATGFPWLVLPAVVVAAVEQTSAVSLGELVLPNPVVVLGAATLQGVPASGAVLRAFLSLEDEAGGTSTRVVSIGETTIGDDGRFMLPLPPTVTLGGVPGSGDGSGDGTSSTSSSTKP